VVESMWVGESGLQHAEIFGTVVHIAHELLRVEFYAFIVLGQVDASNF
jgi:hypothetical protein